MRNVSSRSDWKDGFLFLGNELVLDFVNTRPIQAGEARELLKDFGAVLRWFQAAGLLDLEQAASLEHQWGRTNRAQQATETLKDLRERLRAEILAWEQGRGFRRSTINELNGLMGVHPMLTRLIAKGAAYSTEPWFEAREPEDLSAPLAQSAASTVTSKPGICGQGKTGQWDGPGLVCFTLSLLFRQVR